MRMRVAGLAGFATSPWDFNEVLAQSIRPAYRAWAAGDGGGTETRSGGERLTRSSTVASTKRARKC